MKKQLFIALSILGIGTFGFGQTQQDSSSQSATTAQAHSGISYNAPSGSWAPIPTAQSLVPYMDNKIQEQIESEKKVTVVYQTAGAYADIPSLFDQVKSVFALNWGNPIVVQQMHLISPDGEKVFHGPRKFSAVYKIVEELTQTTFRLEVVVVSSFDMRGNKGVLYILCPERSYYDNRFLIQSVRDALVLDNNAATNTAKPSKTA